MNKFIIFLSAILLTFTLSAQEGDRPERDRPPGDRPEQRDRPERDRPPGDRPEQRDGDRRRGPGEKDGERKPGFGQKDGRRGGMMMGRMMERFKKDNPEEFERLMKLKKENPEKFKEELGKLIRKRMQHMSGDWMKKLKEENPERFKQIMSLKDQDPRKFREEIMKEIGRRMHDHGGDRHKQYADIRRLLEAYKTASEADKPAAKAKLRAEVVKFVEQDLKNQEARAKKMEEYLSNIKKQIEDRRSNMEAAVEEKLEKIIKGDYHRKGPGDGKGKDFRRRPAPEGEVERP